VRSIKTACSALSACVVALGGPVASVGAIAVVMAAAPGSANAACRYVVGAPGHGDGVECTPDESPQAPLTWAAIAISPTHVVAGMSYAYRSKADAAIEAWRQCSLSGPNCKVVMTATLCVAVARDDAGTDMSWASAQGLAQARRTAVGNCNARHAGTCSVLLSGCP